MLTLVFGMLDSKGKMIMCAKLRTYKLLLFLRLSGGIFNNTNGLYLQVNTLLVIYIETSSMSLHLFIWDL